MKNAPAFRPGILPGRRVNGYKADSSRYFAGIFRPCKRGLGVWAVVVVVSYPRWCSRATPSPQNQKSPRNPEIKWDFLKPRQK
ncbi:hypothetical protein TNCV_2095821 [Trichonephila clavipes]|nr:hypothetical protein TNCV_2095821 [Trichonephila clavipes]